MYLTVDQGVIPQRYLYNSVFDSGQSGLIGALNVVALSVLALKS